MPALPSRILGIGDGTTGPCRLEYRDQVDPSGEPLLARVTVRHRAGDGIRIDVDQ